jgi:hypothetical protein
MVQKCANPPRSSQFHSLRQGRVFVKEVESNPDSDNKRRVRHLEYFWLCDSCCRNMTVIAEKGNGVRVEPLPAFAISGQIVS